LSQPRIAAPGSGTDVTYIDEAITLYDPRRPGWTPCFEWRKYYYKVQAIDNEDLSSVFSDPNGIDGYEDACSGDDGDNMHNVNNNIPKDYSLYNYPNPFNPITEIRFSLPKDENVTIKVFNLLGEEIITLVNNIYKGAGMYSVTFDGTNLASGLYLYRIESGSFVQTKKMILVK
jgi:hypothetical protein